MGGSVHFEIHNGHVNLDRVGAGLYDGTVKAS